MITVLLALVVLSGPMEVKSLYECSGVAPNGRAYKGPLKIEQEGNTFLFTWGDELQIGVGVRQGDKIAVGLVDRASKGLGVVLYTVSQGGLEGVWTFGGGLTFTETCVLPNSTKA